MESILKLPYPKTWHASTLVSLGVIGTHLQNLVISYPAPAPDDKRTSVHQLTTSTTKKQELANPASAVTSSRAAGCGDTVCTVKGPHRAGDPQTLQPPRLCRAALSRGQGSLPSPESHMQPSLPPPDFHQLGSPGLSGKAQQDGCGCWRAAERQSLHRANHRGMEHEQNWADAERSVMGPFKQGYLWVLQPSHTHCRHTPVLPGEGFQPKPPWGNSLNPLCQENATAEERQL